MSETQKTITDWSRATFGEHGPLSTLTRCLVEQAELFSIIEHEGTRDQIRDELGDVQIIFDQVGEKLSIDLTQVQPSGSAFPGDKWVALRCAGMLGSALFNLATELADHDAPTEHVISLVDEAQGYLCDLAEILELDLRECVDRKMKINRAREWKKLPSGRFQHA